LVLGSEQNLREETLLLHNEAVNQQIVSNASEQIKMNGSQKLKSLYETKELCKMWGSAGQQK
jgi:hypothetical protein